MQASSKSLGLAAGLAAAALAVGACAGRMSTKSETTKASPEVAASASQLQLRAFEMGRNLSGLIEQAADSIIVASADPDIRRNALLWKISGIPLVQEAALRNDPLVATVDLLAFTVQQRDYLTTGSGRESFGAQQPIAVAAAREAEREAVALLSSALQSGQRADSSEVKMTAWAASHPMTGPALRRASILESDWAVLGISSSSIGASIGNVDRTMVNLTYRLSYLNETMAEEVRWNAQLAAEQAMHAPRVDSLVGASTATLRSVGTLSDEAPALIDREREAMMRDIDGERVAMMRDIDRQRVLAFQDLAAQRVALEAALSAEGKVLMERVGQERVASFLSADSLTQRSIERAGAVVRRLVWESALATGLIVVALLGAARLLISHWRATAPRRAGSDLPAA
jgi:hypothetical protein